MSDELLTVNDIALHFRLRPWTIRHWVSDGRIPYLKLGGAVRFRKSDIDGFELRNRHGNKADDKKEKKV